MNFHLPGEVNIVDREGIVRLDGLDVTDGEVRAIERLPCGRHVGHRHQTLLRATLPERQNTHDNLRITAQLGRLVAVGHQNTCIAVGRIGLRAKGNRAAFRRRLELRQAVGCRRKDALVSGHRADDLSSAGVLDFNRPNHESLQECRIVLEGFLILLIAHEGHFILGGAVDARLLGDVVGRLKHGTLRIWITAEVVPHPVFVRADPTDAHWIRIVDMRRVAGAVAQQGENG